MERPTLTVRDDAEANFIVHVLSCKSRIQNYSGMPLRLPLDGLSFNVVHSVIFSRAVLLMSECCVLSAYIRGGWEF